MNFFKNAFLAVTITSVMAGACAENWVKVSEGGYASMHVETSRISRTKYGLKAWVLYTSDEALYTDDYRKIKYMSSKSLSYFNCSDNSIIAPQVYGYDGTYGSGKVVWTSSYPIYQLQWTEAIPGSMGDAVIRFVCSRRKTKGT